MKNIILPNENEVNRPDVSTEREAFGSYEYAIWSVEDALRNHLHCCNCEQDARNYLRGKPYCNQCVAAQLTALIDQANTMGVPCVG